MTDSSKRYEQDIKTDRVFSSGLSNVEADIWQTLQSAVFAAPAPVCNEIYIKY